ncbi:hypothetical protein, partial [Streptomyces sp. NPDC056983]|uniref:hypothetical protein n=1 Tax=Streptomyces sp. NPDC056983 TaxID=3345987 RepID=UPI00363A4165
MAPALLPVSRTGDGGPGERATGSRSARTSDGGGRKKRTAQVRTAVDATAADDDTGAGALHDGVRRDEGPAAACG